jgi:hypothetical protein
MKYPFLKAAAQLSADMLGLSLAGALKIAAYDEETHHAAFESYMNSTVAKQGEIKDPLRFYIYLANDHCRSNYLDPDFKILNQLSTQYKINHEDDLYLPLDQRVKIELPAQDYKTKDKKKKTEETSPYRPATHPWKKPNNAFKFGPTEPRKLDDIAEAIKLVGYMASGIQGPVIRNLPTADCFAKRASIVIEELITKNEKYHLDIVGILHQIDKFIDYSLIKHRDLAHIREISSSEDAKLKARQAIAEFVPVLLKPFREKRLMQ